MNIARRVSTAAGGLRRRIERDSVELTDELSRSGIDMCLFLRRCSRIRSYMTTVSFSE